MKVSKRLFSISFFLNPLSFILMLFIGGCTMASELSFSWEWPDDRFPDHKLAVRVEQLKPHSTGFLGLRKSPSFVASMPDPIVLTGKVVAGNVNLIGKSIKIVLPKLELGNVSADDTVAVGVLDAGTCICLTDMPVTEREASTWLEQWQCPVKD